MVSRDALLVGALLYDIGRFSDCPLFDGPDLNFYFAVSSRRPLPAHYLLLRDTRTFKR